MASKCVYVVLYTYIMTLVCVCVCMCVCVCVRARARIYIVAGMAACARVSVCVMYLCAYFCVHYRYDRRSNNSC